jgi:hypothetical protein
MWPKDASLVDDHGTSEPMQPKALSGTTLSFMAGLTLSGSPPQVYAPFALR